MPDAIKRVRKHLRDLTTRGQRECDQPPGPPSEFALSVNERQALNSVPDEYAGGLDFSDEFGPSDEASADPDGGD